MSCRDNVNQESSDGSPNIEAVNSQSTPDDPRGQETQAISDQSVQSDIKDIDNRVKRAERWMIWLTGAIALFALGAVVVGVLQWRVMSGQLREMKSGGVDTHNLAVASLSTSRAWIVVSATGFGYKNDAARATARVTITNTGPSPAFNVHIWRCARKMNTEPPVDIEPVKSDVPDCVEDGGIGMLGKNVPVPFDTDDFSQNIAKDSLTPSMHDPGPHFYVWGRITYDIYPKDRRHFTSFCLLNAGTQLGPCTKGNDGD